MLGKRVEAGSLRSVQEDSHEIGNEQNHRVEIIYLPEGILSDRRRNGLHVVPADVVPADVVPADVVPADVVPADVVIDRPSKASAPKGKNWSRRLNVAFGVLSALVLVLPAILSAYLGIGIHPVVTGSMRPTFQLGDLMISRIERASHVKVGDVVLLMSPITGEMQAHRVTSKTTSGESTTFVTKGDANPAPDAPVKIASVSLVRHITSVVPKLGKATTAFSSTIARKVIGISFIAILLMTVLIWAVRRRNDRKQSNLNATYGK